MLKGSFPRDKILENLLNQIIKVTKKIPSINYFHVLHEKNKEANECANEGCILKFGEKLDD